MRFPLLTKVMAIALVVVLLSMVLLRIEWLVDERSARQRQARASVEQSLAGAQTLLGPLLQRNCVEEWEVEVGEGKERRTVTQRREFWQTSTPATLAVAGDARAEARYRGLFKVNGYAATTTLEAKWDTLADLQAQREQRNSRLQCGAVSVMVALSDVRGIRSARIAIDGVQAPVRAGTTHPQFPRGLHAELAKLPDPKSDARPDAGAIRSEQSLAAPLAAPLVVRVALDLVGTARLSLVPAAGDTSWTLHSDWPHPSFIGRFLPATREISAAGFDARWTLSALATSAAADVKGPARLCAPRPAADGDYGEDGARGQRYERGASAAAAGAAAAGTCLDSLDVEFIDPVNAYVLTDRAVKYALLFILLTFTAVALTEVLAARRVHPVQYTLVGLALALFFLLLLSLSEHLAFEHAYTVASAGCVLLLGYYAAHMMGRPRAGLAFGSGVALMYGLLWVLLRQEQTALVIGSSMLFAVLAVVMVLTRRVDWYALFGGLRRPAGPRAPAPPTPAGPPPQPLASPHGG